MVRPLAAGPRKSGWTMCTARALRVRFLPVPSTAGATTTVSRPKTWVFAAKDVRQEVVATEALLLLLLLAVAAGIRRYRALLQVFPCLCSVFFVCTCMPTLRGDGIAKGLLLGDFGFMVQSLLFRV